MLLAQATYEIKRHVARKNFLQAASDDCSLKPAVHLAAECRVPQRIGLTLNKPNVRNRPSLRGEAGFG
jgi:hypothetical protein